jgi:hypothetical protein
MIPRRLERLIDQRLSQFPAVALLGRRQVGKTTLARMCRGAEAALYLDLENPVDLEKLVAASG